MEKYKLSARIVDGAIAAVAKVLVAYLDYHWSYLAWSTFTLGTLPELIYEIKTTISTREEKTREQERVTAVRPGCKLEFVTVAYWSTLIVGALTK